MRRLPLVFGLLISATACLFSNVNSSTGNITFDVDNDQIFEAHLSSSGLGIGTTPSANLHVAGNMMVTKNISIGSSSSGASNLQITGTLATSFRAVSSNVSLTDYSLFFADSTSGNLTLTLPDASNSNGRIITIKKTSASNNITIGGGGSIDGYSSVRLHSGSRGFIKVISNSNKWLLLSASENIDYLSFSPTDIASLVVWYDASDLSTITSDAGGNVTQWDDKSGNDYHAIAGTAAIETGNFTINGLNVLSGDNIDRNDSMTISPTTSSAKTCFAVAYLKGTSTGRLINFGSSGTNPSFFVRGNSDQISFDGGGSTQGSFSINAATYSANAENHSGAAVGLSPPQTFLISGVYQTPSTLNKLFGYNGTNGPTNDTQLAEVAWFSDFPSEEDREKMEGYLAHKWGLENELPADHPYKDSAP